MLANSVITTLSLYDLSDIDMLGKNCSIKFIYIFLPLLFFFNNASAQNSKVILENMIRSIKEIQTLTFKLKKAERIGGVLKNGEQDVKYQGVPHRKIYTYIHKPNTGVELLWIEGKNSTALIHPNGFPYVNLNLDPYGSNMRKGNHHTIYEVGFDYIGDIVSQIMKQNSGNLNELISAPTNIQFDNRACYKIVIDIKNFKYVEYTVKKGETLVSIAYKNLISDFMILEKNPKLKGFEDVKEGQKILVPNIYAKKTVLYIDKVNNLPIVQIMYDEKGLYEQYEFFNLVVNPKIEDVEFTPAYKDYNF